MTHFPLASVAKLLLNSVLQKPQMRSSHPLPPWAAPAIPSPARSSQPLFTWLLVCQPGLLQLAMYQYKILILGHPCQQQLPCDMATTDVLSAVTQANDTARLVLGAGGCLL